MTLSVELPHTGEMMELASNNKRNQLEKSDLSRELVEKASAGCSDSFRQLVEQNHRQVRLYIGRYVQCPSQVDDIAQEVFFIAFREMNRFLFKSKFSTWLIGIARNKALEFLKAEIKTRERRKQLFEAEIASRQIARLEHQHREADLAQQRLTAMQFCLEQLPSKSRQLIDGYYFDQQTANSIAKKADISAGAVRMKLLRIRQILQKCIVARLQDASEDQSVLELELDNE